jgi:hypothetical protein
MTRHRYDDDDAPKTMFSISVEELLADNQALATTVEPLHPVMKEISR